MSAAPPPATPPRLALPEGACDTHTHIFGPLDRFPLAVEPRYDPPDAPSDGHQAMRRAVGLSRAVLVQPAPYGTDCSAMLDAIARADGALRGIALATAATSPETLRALHAAGVDGLRFTEARMPGGGAPFPGSVGFADMVRLAPAMAEIGLHAQVWADCDRIAADADLLAGLGVPVVLDHMGRFDVARGPADPDFRRLLGLLAEGRVWVKLALCRNSDRHPDYPDLRPFHDALVAANPDRLLWASDWPFIGMGAGAPDPGHLIDLFDAWTGGDAGLRRRILADNPARLYRFPPLPSPRATN